MSWHQEEPARSLALIESTGVDRRAPIVDVGGGASHLVDRLVATGFADITVLDVSPTALDYARDRLGDRAGDVTWVVADVTRHDFKREFALWHDRAVYHFLTEPADRERYLETLRRSISGGAHVIVAAFGPDGPTTCSGLPVQRYSPESMTLSLGESFEPQSFETEAHVTPTGATQHFIYGVFRKA